MDRGKDSATRKTRQENVLPHSLERFRRSEDTWEPEANLKGTQALQDYKKSLKKTIRTIDTY